MNELQYAEENRTNVAGLINDGPASTHGVPAYSKGDGTVDAVIRLKLQNLEGKRGAEATERLRQQLVDLARTELFPGDEIVEFGNGQLGMLLRDRHQQHVLFIAQSMQYFLQGGPAEGWEQPITVRVTFFDGTLKRRRPALSSRTEKKPAAIGQGSLNRTYRIAVLSDDHDLARRIYASMSELHVDVLHAESMDQANTLIDFGFSDITVVDINGAGAWPGLVVQRFDQRAQHHRVLFLCGDADETRHYHGQSLHAVNILPLDAVGDPLFPDIMQQALTLDFDHDTSSSPSIEVVEHEPPEQAGRDRNMVAAA